MRGASWVATLSGCLSLFIVAVLSEPAGDETCQADCQADGTSCASAIMSKVIGTRAMRVDLPFVRPEHLRSAESFEPQLGDVFVVTYPKCGTTWTQQLCHQLRSAGHVDFEEISEERVVPWLEISPALGIDTSLAQVAAPRVFKTHQMLSALSRFEASGARFLCVLRDPEATLLSFFKFELTKNAPGTQAKDVNVYAKASFLPGAEVEPKFGGTLWDFYLEFWRCRALTNVLLVAYEDLKQDLEAQILLIAAFMGLPTPDAELRAKVLHLGSFAWMLKNEHLFDDHHMALRLGSAQQQRESDGTQNGEKVATTPKIGLTLGDDVNVKVTAETRDLLAKAWRQEVQPVTGHASYQEMLKELRKTRT